GSRLVMNNYYSPSEHEPGWKWAPGVRRYKRYGKIEWTDDGEMRWTRKLAKLPPDAATPRLRDLSDYTYKKAIYSRTCQYNKKLELVECEEQILSRGRLKADDFIENSHLSINGPYYDPKHSIHIINKILDNMD